MDADDSLGARFARHREALDAAPGTWPAKRKLAAAVRALLDTVLATDAPEAELLELAARIDAAARRFREQGAPARSDDNSDERVTGMEDFHDRSPMVGLANAMAPPAVLEPDMEGGVVRGSVEFGSAFEGGPGLVHGGFSASLLDEALGMATVFSGNPGMTGELTVRYLRPTPIRTPLRLEARFDRRDGRKIFTSGELYQGDQPLVTASGLFIAVQFEKFAEFHEERGRREDS